MPLLGRYWIAVKSVKIAISGVRAEPCSSAFDVSKHICLSFLSPELELYPLAVIGHQRQGLESVPWSRKPRQRRIQHSVQGTSIIHQNLCPPVYTYLTFLSFGGMPPFPKPTRSEPKTYSGRLSVITYKPFDQVSCSQIYWALGQVTDRLFSAHSC